MEQVGHWPPYRPTRFKGLGYRCDAPGLWRFYNLLDGCEDSIGAHYASKEELLSDIERYATEYGFERK